MALSEYDGIPNISRSCREDADYVRGMQRRSAISHGAVGSDQP
jgi:hypothetical protein